MIANKHNKGFRSVRVSDSTFAEVQKHAEPLDDTFNVALRKALKLPREESRRTK